MKISVYTAPVHVSQNGIVKYFFPFAIIFLLISCSDNKKHEAALNEIAAVLTESSKDLDGHAKARAQELNDKLNDYALKEKAMQYFPKVTTIQTLAARSAKTLDSLQQLLSGENYAAVAKQAAQVYRSFADSLLATDPEIKETFVRFSQKSNAAENYATLPIVGSPKNSTF